MKVELFKTPIGNYFLPSEISTDCIVNTMKAGDVFEPEIVETSKRFIRIGTNVLDIGANFGQMSLFFSEMVGENGTVYSFEAAEDVYEVLIKNIEENKRKNIIPYCNAVFDTVGELKFYPEPDFSRFAAYGSYGIDPKAKQGRTISTISIDSLKIPGPVSFMKVDIQGSDLFAMRGARELIMRERMPILFEYEEQFQNEFGTSFADYMNFIDSIQYKIAEIISDINFLIVPKEMCLKISTSQNLKTKMKTKLISVKSVFGKYFNLS